MLQHRQTQKANASRLRLTSQMGCNCLINPMFAIFYAFYYGLFGFRAVPSADSPSLGEGPCEKSPRLPDRSHTSQDVECAVWVGQHLPWKWLEQYYLPCPVPQFYCSPFQSGFLAKRCMITAGLPSSAQRSPKAFFSTVRESQKNNLDIWKWHSRRLRQMISRPFSKTRPRSLFLLFTLRYSPVSF